MLTWATGLGFGYAPKAPGTAGSLLGPPLVWAWHSLQLPTAAGFAAFAVLIVFGIWVCHQAGQYFGRVDPGAVVFDEIAAFPVVFFAIPLTPTTAVAGFLWFRLFDVWKPWPIHRLEKLPGGLGVMADDQAAAIYAAAALWLTVFALGGP